MKVSLFAKSGCVECRKLKPILQKYSERYGFEFQPISLETDGVELFIKNHVTGTPVVVISDDGVEKGRFTGHQTETSIEAHLKKFGVIK